MPEPDEYERLREANRPQRLRVLLIGESPPDPASKELRFFYAPQLSAHDNLYRAVALALYEGDPGFDLRKKSTVLARLRNDGFWLIDAVSHPINKDSRSARVHDIRLGVADLVQRCVRLRPEVGVIICHTVVFVEAAEALRKEGVRVLHDEPLPFPLGNWRQRFIDGVRDALRKADAVD